jgi:hypothetical protein
MAARRRIIAAQVSPDLVNVFSGRTVEGVMGATLAGTLLFYLLQAHLHSDFERHRSGSAENLR